MEITKHLFLNLAILIILLFFCWVFFDKCKKFSFSNFSKTIIFIILIWICIQFSYSPDSYERYDLRIIPLVIGSLYVGIGSILVGSIIILRGFFGLDSGFYLTILLYAPLSIILKRLHLFFWKQNSLQRILISVLLGMILGILTVCGRVFITPHSNLLDEWFAYLVIPPLGIGIISYTIEFINRSMEMRLQLIKAEKLKVVEQLGAAISHEIRNPLTAASGFVQLLQDDYLPRHKRKEYLSLVKDELNSAEKVIQDYLTFAKPSLETLEELQVKNELKQIINILLPLANQNSVQILTDYSAIGFIKGDRQKFRQCFVNVLKNAIESMPNGGNLSISTELNYNKVTVSVQDTGIGMTNEQIERLGEPFYSTKGKNGTGLGMMVVYSIARAMDGKIRVESEVGVGTTFHFEFPASLTFMKISEPMNYHV